MSSRQKAEGRRQKAKAARSAMKPGPRQLTCSRFNLNRRNLCLTNPTLQQIPLNRAAAELFRKQSLSRTRFRRVLKLEDVEKPVPKMINADQSARRVNQSA